MKTTNPNILILLISTLFLLSCKKENRTKKTQVKAVVVDAVRNIPLEGYEFEIVEFVSIKGGKSKVVASGKSTIDGIINVNIETVKHKTYRYKLLLVELNTGLDNLVLDASDLREDDAQFEKRITKGEMNDLTFELVKRVRTIVNIFNEDCQSDDVLQLESANLHLDRSFGVFFDFHEKFSSLEGCIEEEYDNLQYTFAGTNLIRKTITENGTTTVSVDTVYLGYTDAEVDTIQIVY